MEILYKKKVIRDFLSLYNENTWIPLITHICEYGIILFKKKYTIASLNPQDIYRIIENFKVDEHIYDKKMKLNSTRDNSFTKRKNIHHTKSKSTNNGNKSFSSNKRLSSVKSNLSDKNVLSNSRNNSKSKRNYVSSRLNLTPNKNKNDEFKCNLHKRIKTTINSSNKKNQTIKNFDSNKLDIKTKSKIRDFSNNKSKENSFIKNKTLNNTNSNIENQIEKNNNNNIINTYINNKNNNYKPINNKLTFQKIKSTDLNFKLDNISKNQTEIKNQEDDKIMNLKGENKLKALIDLNRKQNEEINLNKNNLILKEINNNNINENNKETPKIINTNTNMIISYEEDRIKEKKYEGIFDENSNFSFNNTKLLDNSPIDTENNISNAINILKNIEEKNNNINNDNKKERYCLNDAPIISLEEKLNGLNKKLSNLNSSFNKTKEILSNYNQDIIFNSNYNSNINKFNNTINNNINNNNFNTKIINNNMNNNNYNNNYFQNENQSNVMSNSISLNSTKQNFNIQNQLISHSSVFSSEDFGYLNK